MYYGVFVNNQARKELGITANAYIVCALIGSLCKRGWCTMSRAKMADEIGLSKVSVINIIDKLETMFLVQKNEAGNVRVLPKWIGAIARHEAAKKAFFEGKESIPHQSNTGKESLPSSGKESIPTQNQIGKESLPIGKESLPQIGKESLPNTLNLNTISYTLSNGERKTFSIEDYCKAFGMSRVSLTVKENFKTLPTDIKIIIAEHLPKYLKATPEKRYQKSPLNYILDEAYLLPIIDRTQQPKNGQLANPTVLPTATHYKYRN